MGAPGVPSRRTMSHRDRLTILGNSHQQNLSQKPRRVASRALEAHSHASALAALSRGKVCRQFVGSGCTAGSAVPPYGRRCPASDLEWFRCLPAPPDRRRRSSLNDRRPPWSREPRDSEGRRGCAECPKMVPYGVRDGPSTVGDHRAMFTERSQWRRRCRQGSRQAFWQAAGMMFGGRDRSIAAHGSWLVIPATCPFSVKSRDARSHKRLTSPSPCRVCAR